MYTAKNILVPLDFSDTSRAALSVALQIADRSPGARLVLLHCDPTLKAEMDQVLRRDVETRELVEGFAQREEAMRKALAVELGRAAEQGHQLRAPEAEIRVSAGDWLEAALQTIKDEEIDLVCCATHGGEATGLRGLVQGSLTERLVHKAPCSVFVVKAAGFPYLTD